MSYRSMATVGCDLICEEKRGCTLLTGGVGLSSGHTAVPSFRGTRAPGDCGWCRPWITAALVHRVSPTLPRVSRGAAAPQHTGLQQLCSALFLQEWGWKARLMQAGAEPPWTIKRGKHLHLCWKNIFLGAGCCAVPARSHGGVRTLGPARGVKLPHSWISPDVPSICPGNFA